jgi:uncharacterized protein involved in type VI secretion and phage assembly
MTSDVYDAMFARQSLAGLFHGVVIALVTNVRDPDNAGRVKVKLPWLPDAPETDWARVAVPVAGNGWGMFFPLEVDAEVLVAFEHGNPAAPYVIGVLWNGKDKPPAMNQDGKSDVRQISTRSGHIVRFTDKSGGEKIEIIDKTTKNSIVFDSSKNALTITADTDITIEAKSGKLKLSGQTVEIAAKSTAKVEGQSGLTLKGATVNIN